MATTKMSISTKNKKYTRCSVKIYYVWTLSLILTNINKENGIPLIKTDAENMVRKTQLIMTGIFKILADFVVCAFVHTNFEMYERINSLPRLSSL